MGSRTFVLYDGRARWGDTEDASVMDTADSEAEARRTGRTLWDGHDAVWFEYDENGDERMRPDLPPFPVEDATDGE